ncbi:MAG: colicin V production protein [Flavobacteriales bacterium]|nr:MAG: colicin V production protein [Flavobacteriales bacterium]
MNYFDIIIIIPLIWGAYKGFKKGFIIEIASFIALGLGVWGGIKFSAISAKYLSEAFDISEKIMPLISFAVTFILIVIVVFMLAKMLQKIISMIALGFINKAAGSLFGMLKFGLIMSVIINFTNIINNQINFIDPEMKSSSVLFEPIGKVAQIIIPGLKEISVNGILENAVMEEAASILEAASENLN